MAKDGTKTTEDGIKIVINLAPVPASRPRVTRWGAYYGKRYAEWKKQAQAHFPKEFEKLAEGKLQATVHNVCKRPQRLTSDTPNGDIDNYTKAALDAVNDAGIWGDDRQVTHLTATKRYAEEGEQPHTTIIIKREKNNAKD